MRGEHFAHEALAVVVQVRDCALYVLLDQQAGVLLDERWALPGGRVRADERLGACVSRHLGGIFDTVDTVDTARKPAHAPADIAHLEQLETRSDPARDPRERVLATAYLALIPADTEPVLPPNACWHSVERLPAMASDHASIVGSAVERLRGKLSYTTIALALAPPQFTIAALRSIYAAALGHDVSPTNLQRVLSRRGALVPVGATVAAGAAGGRPAQLFRFTSSSVQVTDAFAILRPPAD